MTPTIPFSTHATYMGLSIGTIMQGGKRVCAVMDPTRLDVLGNGTVVAFGDGRVFHVKDDIWLTGSGGGLAVIPKGEPYTIKERRNKRR